MVAPIEMTILKSVPITREPNATELRLMLNSYVSPFTTDTADVSVELVPAVVDATPVIVATPPVDAHVPAPALFEIVQFLIGQSQGLVVIVVIFFP